MKYHPNVIKGRDYRFVRTVPRAEVPSLARGTRQDVRPMATHVEPELGGAWLWTLWAETLARNLAVAAGLYLSYRMGMADNELTAMRERIDARKKARRE